MIFKSISIFFFLEFFFSLFFFLLFVLFGGPVYLSEDYVLLFSFLIFFLTIYKFGGVSIQEYFFKNFMEFRLSFLNYFEMIVEFSLEIFNLLSSYFKFIRFLRTFIKLLGFYFKQFLFYFSSFAIFEVRFFYRIFVIRIFKNFFSHSRKNFRQRWSVLFFRFRRRRPYMDEYNWLIAGLSYRRDFIGSWLVIPHNHFSKQSKLPLFWLEYRKNIYETPWFKSYKFRTWTR